MAHRKGKDSPYWSGFGEVSGAFMKQMRVNADVRDLRIELTAEDVWGLFEKQDERCALTGVELAFGSHYLKDDITASPDRIDRTKGYVPGNVRLTHKVVNVMKLDLSDEEFTHLCSLVAKPIRSRKISKDCTPRKWRSSFRGEGNISGSNWRNIQNSSAGGGIKKLKRDIPFKIKIKYAWTLFLQQRGRCALTGLELDFDRYLGKDETGKVRFYRGSASLDRIDSKKGYTKNNCQWVHKNVNRMKGKLDQKEFKKWCKLVAKYNDR
jgi:hypothetical protein